MLSCKAWIFQIQSVDGWQKNSWAATFAPFTNYASPSSSLLEKSTLKKKMPDFFWCKRMLGFRIPTYKWFGEGTKWRDFFPLIINFLWLLRHRSSEKLLPPSKEWKRKNEPRKKEESPRQSFFFFFFFALSSSSEVKRRRWNLYDSSNVWTAIAAAQGSLQGLRQTTLREM